MTPFDKSLCDRYVIFLDIDGVLLPVPRFQFGGGDLSVECVHRLRQLVDFLGGAAKVSLILSSTWRNFPDMVERLNQLFERETKGGLPRIAGGTPNGTVKVSEVTYYADDLTERRLVRDRVDEIYRWLHTHVTEHPEAIGGRWFAIDDMQLDVDPRMAGHFLHTVTDVGMTEADLETAKQSVCSGHPSPHEAYMRASAAFVDPALKDEEIEILQIQRSRWENEAASLKAQLQTAQCRITELSAANHSYLKERAELLRNMEDMSYRLAIVEFSKRNELLREAVQLAAQKSGKERKEIDEYIRNLVNLLRTRKTIDKKLKAQEKKMRMTAQ